MDDLPEAQLPASEGRSQAVSEGRSQASNLEPASASSVLTTPPLAPHFAVGNQALFLRALPCPRFGGSPRGPLPVRSRPEGEGDLLASVSRSVKWECSPADDWISSVSYNGIFSSKKEWSPPNVGFHVDEPQKPC